jgi:hypothetical protein
MEDGLLQAINDVMEPLVGGAVEVQMDNAPGHVGLTVVEDLETFCEDNGLNITFALQPPQSPDLNILDLSFFSSLQARSNRLKIAAGNKVENLMECVDDAFWDYDSDTVEVHYGILFEIYNLILETEGNNNFQMPHNDIRRRQQAGTPLNLVRPNLREVRRLQRIVRDYFDNE